MKKRVIFFGISILPILGVGFFIFHTWFGFSPLSSGDWWYHYPVEVREFSFVPVSWNSVWNGGLGGNGLFLVPLETYYRGAAGLFMNVFGLPWTLYERVVWYWMYLFVGWTGAIYFASLFVPMVYAVSLAPVIYVTNTYALILVSGGQMGVAMAYGFAPWVVGYAIRSRRPVIGGFFFALQMLFDPRIAYITAIGIATYILLSSLARRDSFDALGKQMLRSFIVPLLFACGLHAFWILPLIVYRNNPIADLGAAYSSIDALRFFSFTDYSHALSLLHGNWPENVFGKTGFLQPEFLLLPLLAFGGLLTIRKEDKKVHSFLVLAALGLGGVFLAKGTNKPFGAVYEWLFRYMPGFNVFRDASKFFLLVALAYTALIPCALVSFVNLFKSKKHLFRILAVLAFFVFWAFTLRGTWMGVTKGTLAAHTIPQSYREVKDRILADPQFSRSLWVPQVHRYAIATDMHPAMSAQEALGVASQAAVFAWFQNEQRAQKQLARWAVHYVVVPQDTHTELFLDDRRYSQKKRAEVVQFLDTLPWLHRVSLWTHDIDLYEYNGPFDHFFLESGLAGLWDWEKIDVATYRVRLSAPSEHTILVFSERFDPGWTMVGSGQEVGSVKTKDGLNSFSIAPLRSDSTETIVYKPHQLLMKGLWISLATFVCMVVLALRQRFLIQ